jgi:hypothetical protein
MDHKHDAGAQDVSQYIMIDSVLHHIHMMNNRTHIDHMMLQVCLPKSMVPRILQEMHDAPFSGHLSTAKTYARVLERYYWKGMYDDIKNYCESCVVCSRRKVPHRQGNIPMLSPQVDLLTEYGPMECVALDIIGPITMANDKTTVILTMVDLYTRTGEACALRQQRTKHIAETFVVKWVCKYGFPRTIVCDNGPGFASKVMKAAMKLLGIKTHYVLPYHPQSNGVCERLNATIINMLSSYTRDKQNMWSGFLPYIVFAYNTSVHSSTGFTPYRLLHGREAVIGSEALLRTRDEHEHVDYPTYIKQIQHNMATANDLISQRVQQAAAERNMVNQTFDKAPKYNVGDQVYVYWPPKSSKKDGVSGKLMSPYRGPFTVTHQFNAVSYRVKENSTNKHVSVHVSRMKKAVVRDTQLVSDEEERSIDSSDGPERDHGVHEYTRTQRQQRVQQQQQDAQQESDSEDEEGQVPEHIAKQVIAQRASRA